MAGLRYEVAEYDSSKETCINRTSATLLVAPVLITSGIVGYVWCICGIRTLTTLLTGQFSASFMKRFYKNWYRQKIAVAFFSYSVSANSRMFFTSAKISYINNYSSCLRIIYVTRSSEHSDEDADGENFITEIQVNGGNVFQKLLYSLSMLNRNLKANSVFSAGDFLDVISVSQGNGVRGVVARWGVTILPRKTRRGRKKVACVGAWHPASLKWTVCRSGQFGYYKRTEIRKRIIRLGGISWINDDLSLLGGTRDCILQVASSLSRYGKLHGDFFLIRGSVPGAVRRVVSLRRSVVLPCFPDFISDFKVKFIDTGDKQIRCNLANQLVFHG